MSNRKAGFTWVEIIIVVIILSIMTAVAVPLVRDYMRKQEATRKELRNE